MLFSSLSNAPTSTTAAMEPSCTTSTTTTTTVTTNTTTTITSSINLNLRPLISTGMSNTDPFSASSVPVTSTVNSILTPVVTYSPLDDLRFELEQEKQDFLELASRLEALDRTLNENGEEVGTGIECYHLAAEGTRSAAVSFKDICEGPQ
ncbi:nucleoporin-62 C-terminal-like protein isoform X2 [Castor canadensis]